MKTCSGCRQELPLEAFTKRKASKDGLQHRCKTCVAAHLREWRKANPEKDKEIRARYHQTDKYRAYNRDYQRGSHFLKRYGITVGEYEAMVVAQKGSCAMCKKKPEVLVVDHCHETGAVRGLLCGPCNTGIGMLNDSIALLHAGIHYLSGKAQV